MLCDNYKHGGSQQHERMKPDKARKQFAALARKYRTPKQVQVFLRKFPYNHERDKETLRSAYSAFLSGMAHCYEATFIAAAILEQNGFPPLVISFESQDGLGHVVFIFKHKGMWGAVARSRDEGLHGRKPVFRSVRDLVWSYYDPYIDNTGKITEYAVVHLDDTMVDWRSGSRNVWKAEKYMVGLKHTPLKSSPLRYQLVFNRFKKHGHPARKPYWW